MRNQKRLFFGLFLSLALLSCNETTQQQRTDTPSGEKDTSITEETKASPAKTIYLTDADFRTKIIDYEKAKQWKYLGDKPAVIDFYATWCGPCKTIAPMLEELADEYGGRIYVYKIDVDKETNLAATFNIRSIPTLFFIPMDGNPQIIQGARSKEELKIMIDQMLK